MILIAEISVAKSRFMTLKMHFTVIKVSAGGLRIALLLHRGCDQPLILETHKTVLNTLYAIIECSEYLREKTGCGLLSNV